MTDDLSTKLAALTDDRPEPPDPAAPIRLRVKQRQLRRRTAATVLTATAATAAVAMSGPLLGSGGHEPQVAGFAPPPASTAPSSPQPSGDATTVMPPPWSSERFTKLPDANAYRPHAYYIAKGTLPTESFGVLAFSKQGCLVTDEGPANSFGRIYVCFEDWKPGQRSAFFAAPAHSKEKSSQLLDFTLVVGAVSTDARKVRVTTAGKTYTTDAVGTPATDQLRFFAVLVPHKDAKITAVSPVNAKGRLAAAPANPPKHQPCGSACGTATPAK